MSVPWAGRRAAIVCAHWPVHRMAIYIARELACDGMSIDLVLYQAPTDDSLALLEGLPINCLHLGRKTGEPNGQPSSGRRGRSRSLGERILGKAKRTLNRLALTLMPHRALFCKKATAQVEDLVRKQRYSFVLAVEKGGLALVGHGMLENGPPLLYLSLELYTRAHPVVRSVPTIAALRRLESKYAPKVSVFLIQDEPRWQVLRSDLQLGNETKVALLPVSEPEEPEVQTSDFLRKHLAIPANQKILLYFGVIRPERDSIAVAAVADRLPDGWLLVFHGPCTPTTREKIIAQSQAGRIRLSDCLVPSAMRETLIGSADIGLAIYGEQSDNDRLTGFSSEKVALYLKCGVPVIARNNVSYEHLWSNGAGLPIAALEGIPQAVHEISKDHLRYRTGARRTFDRYYSFEKNYGRANLAIAAALAHR
jgi:hypothetical protein